MKSSTIHHQVTHSDPFPQEVAHQGSSNGVQQQRPRRWPQCPCLWRLTQFCFRNRWTIWQVLCRVSCCLRCRKAQERSTEASTEYRKIRKPRVLKSSCMAGKLTAILGFIDIIKPNKSPPNPNSPGKGLILMETLQSTSSTVLHDKPSRPYPWHPP